MVHAALTALDKYKNKYWAFFFGGIYTGKNYYLRLDQKNLDIALNYVPNGTTGSIYVEDAGDWVVFNKGYVPQDWAQITEALSAKRLRFKWHNNYQITSPIRNDTQITITSITGAIRKKNCSQITLKPTRAILSYSVFTLPDAVTHIIRWWNQSRLVAEGIVVGDGPFICTELNASGLTIEGSITYTGDLAPNMSAVELRWPKAYQIHYNTGVLTFPRTPEKIVNDNGLDDYIYLSPELPAGTYHWNILQIDDSNTVQNTAIPVTVDKIIYATPEPPTDLSVTGDAGALTVHWVNGEAGCTYKVYYSDPDLPINFDASSSPTPIGPTAINATSALLDPIVNTGGKDFTSDFATLESSFDSAVVACNLLFAQATFSAAFSALTTSLLNAIDAFSANTDLQVNKYKDSINVVSSDVLATADQLPTLSVSQWATAMGSPYCGFLCLIGQILESQGGRYLLPNGGFANTPNGAATIGTASGTSGFGSALIGISILKAIQPLVRPATVRIVVRATKAGIEEKHDKRYEVEFNSGGDIIPKRPNQAVIQSITITGTTVSVIAVVVSANAVAIPHTLDLYVVPVATPIDFDTPTSSVAFPALTNMQQRATISKSGLIAGAYKVAVKARVDSSGSRSLNTNIQIINITTTTPNAVSTLEAGVLRGREAL